jgi:hypothetical protein
VVEENEQRGQQLTNQDTLSNLKNTVLKIGTTQCALSYAPHAYQKNATATTGALTTNGGNLYSGSSLPSFLSYIIRYNTSLPLPVITIPNIIPSPRLRYIRPVEPVLKPHYCINTWEKIVTKR